MGYDRFAGKIAMVTGFVQGIGRGVAEVFAEEGATVVGVDFNADKGPAAIEELIAAGAAGDSVFVRADLTVEAQMEAAVKLCADKWGRINAFVNAAGNSRNHLITSLTWEEYDYVLKSYLYNVVFMMKHVGRLMLRQEAKGAIVNIGSTNSMQPYYGYSPYCSAKAGIEMASKCAALEFAPKVRVNIVSPGLTATPMTRDFIAIPAVNEEYIGKIPMGAPCDPKEDIGRACYFLCSDEAASITGINMVVDGGNLLRNYPDIFKACPSLMDSIGSYDDQIRQDEKAGRA